MPLFSLIQMVGALTWNLREYAPSVVILDLVARALQQVLGLEAKRAGMIRHHHPVEARRLHNSCIGGGRRHFNVLLETDWVDDGTIISRERGLSLPRENWKIGSDDHHVSKQSFQHTSEEGTSDYNVDVIHMAIEMDAKPSRRP
jgi:hypothetical protein